MAALRRKGVPNTKQRKAKLPSEIAAALGWEPISWMVNLVKTGAILEDDGRKTEVPLDERLKMAREVTVYIVSKAPAVVHGEIDHRHAHIDVTHLMMNPAAAEAAETLALAMLDSPVQDAEFEDVSPPDKA